MLDEQEDSIWERLQTCFGSNCVGALSRLAGVRGVSVPISPCMLEPVSE